MWLGPLGEGAGRSLDIAMAGFERVETPRNAAARGDGGTVSLGEVSGEGGMTCGVIGWKSFLSVC